MRESIVFAIVLTMAVPVFGKEMRQVPAELAPTHGYVHVAFPKGGGDVLSVQAIASGNEYRIDTRSPALPLSYAEAFGRWLPPGEYRVTAVGALKWPNGPTFQVQAGRVTDLGNFSAVNIGGYEVVLLPIDHPEHAGSVEAATASFAGLLQDPVPLTPAISTVSSAMTLGREPSGLGLIADLMLSYDRKVNKPSTLEALKAATDPGEFLSILRKITTPLQDEPARLADGTLLFPADFGQLRKRTLDGKWSAVGMDTLRQILAVEAVEDRLLAGSDDGRIRESLDGGATWVELKAFARNEAIIDIDNDSNTWIVTTTESFDDPDAPRGGGLVAAAKGTPSVRMRVYRGQRHDLGDLSVSREFLLTPKDQVGWMGARGQLVKGSYYVATGTALQRLDLESNQWTNITPGARISQHRVESESAVLTALWSQGAFSKVYVSTDKGDTWSKIGRPPYAINDVQMDSSTTGWASRWNMNAFGGVWEAYEFLSDKNSWRKSWEAPFNCRLMRVAADLPLLCIAPEGSILGLHGDNWEAEFSAQ